MYFKMVTLYYLNYKFSKHSKGKNNLHQIAIFHWYWLNSAMASASTQIKTNLLT